MTADPESEVTADRPRIAVPPSVSPTPAEIEERRERFERVMARREEIGPNGSSTDDLVHQARAELEGEDETQE